MGAAIRRASSSAGCPGVDAEPMVAHVEVDQHVDPARSASAA